MNRRQPIGSIAGAAAATAADMRVSHTKDAKPAFAAVAPDRHQPGPLPLKPARFPGLANALLTSHNDHEDAGARAPQQLRNRFRKESAS
jgi:hypothetical protein